LVVGMHPHVARGNESISNSHVYYSLGNFVFPPITLSDGAVLQWEKECRQGLALEGIFGGDSWIWSEAPLLISRDGCPHRPGSADEEAMRRVFADLSAALKNEFGRGYPALRRKEMLRHYAWRLWTMGWLERFRLLGRGLRPAPRQE